MARKKIELDTESFLGEGDWSYGVGEKRSMIESVASRVNPERNGRHGKIGTLDYIASDSSPFCGTSRGGADVADLIKLSKICFYTQQSYRNAILNQVFLSNTKLLVRGIDEKVTNFYKSWLKKINIWQLCNEFFTEWYRSGNVFFWRATGELKLNEIRKLITGPKESIAKNKKISCRYILLDPESIRSLGAASLVNQYYGKLLTSYEVERLKNPSTDEERDFLDTLDEESRKNIRSGIAPLVKLNPENLVFLFNNRQPYEQLAVPTYSPILKTINLKNAMRASDLLLVETIDLVVFFVTIGTEEGRKNGDNKRLIQGLTSLLSARGASRAIITDFSAKADFVLPDLQKIQSPERYEAIDKDINAGLMDLFSMGDTFASSYTKTKIYLELLRQGQDAFLTQFLIPEMEKIADEMGFESIPSVEFEEISLENETEKLKLYIQLYQLGNLTPEGLVEAFKTKELPLLSANNAQQKEFKTQKEQGLYEPLIGGPKEDAVGRPTGTKQKQTKKTVRPAGASFEGMASLNLIRDNMVKMDEVFASVEKVYKEKNGLQRLSKKQKMISDSVATNIIANEKIESWKTSVGSYVDHPFSAVVSEQRQEIMDIMQTYDIDTIAGSIMYHGMKHD